MVNEYLILGDVHISGRNPPCRKDDLVDTQFRKLKEVMNLSERYKCPIINVGDLVDTPQIGLGILGILTSVITRPFYTIYGNHDLFFHNLESSRNTPTGFLIDVHPFVQHVLSTKIIQYLDWGIGIEQIRSRDSIGLITNKKIVIMHKAVIESKSKRKPPPFVKEHNEEHYVYSDNPKFSGMEVVISGHWHKRGIFEQGNTLFINPGTLTRRRANEDEINTFPSVVILKKNLGKYDYDLIPLKCAKPSEEVISEDHLEETRDKSTLVSGLEDFIFSLKSMNIDYKTKFIVDLLEIIMQPGIERKVEQVIRTTLIDVFGKDYEYEIENYARRSPTNFKILKPKEGEFTRKISRKKLLLKKA